MRRSEIEDAMTSFSVRTSWIGWFGVYTCTSRRIALVRAVGRSLEWKHLIRFVAARTSGLQHTLGNKAKRLDEHAKFDPEHYGRCDSKFRRINEDNRNGSKAEFTASHST